MALEVKLKTLTPLYTGGADGKCDRVHETGLLGSLRWWYEALVRGLGGDVCDPTSNRLDERRPHDGDHYCKVCRLFGATGHSRKFRLRVGDGEALFADAADDHDILLPSGRVDRKSRPRAGGWYLMGSSIMGQDIPLHLVSFSASDVFRDLRLILALIHRHAAFGAKVSNGYGVVQFSEGGQPIQACAPDSPTGSPRPPRNSELPDIRDFFFAKLRFQARMHDANWWQKIQCIAQAWDGSVQDSQGRVYVHGSREAHQRARRNLRYVIQEEGLLPLASAIRNWLRYHWNSGLSDAQKDYLFGTTRQGGVASKLNVSHAYRVDNHDWEFRVWGWLPSRLPVRLGLQRDPFLAALRRTLTDPATWQWVFDSTSPVPNLAQWHALDCQQRDATTFLRELLGLDGGGAS